MPNTAPPAAVTFRRARAADLPRMVELVAAAHLPPVFIEEFLDGFIVAERGGTVIACGGVELYGECAVIRSVVVAEDARKLGLGGRLAEMLIANARDAGALDLYLFTADALPFWLRYGFSEVDCGDWKDPPRVSWQYQFVSQNRDLVPDVHAMWRGA